MILCSTSVRTWKLFSCWMRLLSRFLFSRFYARKVILIFLGELRFKPGAAGSEAQMLPSVLCTPLLHIYTLSILESKSSYFFLGSRKMGLLSDIITGFQRSIFVYFSFARFCLAMFGLSVWLMLPLPTKYLPCRDLSPGQAEFSPNDQYPYRTCSNNSIKLNDS